MRRIAIPDSANATVKLSLGGQTYSFKFGYNTLNQRYYLTIYYEDAIIISGLKLLPNVFLLKKYALPEFSHGDLILVQINKTTEDVGRDNLGVGLPYELFYVSNDEISV